jgi:hypothetical protein
VWTGRDAVGGPGPYPLMHRFSGWKLGTSVFLKEKTTAFIGRKRQGRCRPTVFKKYICFFRYPSRYINIAITLNDTKVRTNKNAGATAKKTCLKEKKRR